MRCKIEREKENKEKELTKLIDEISQLRSELRNVKELYSQSETDREILANQVA